MLQRIQTVFMFLAVMAGVLIFFFPIATYTSDNYYITFFIHLIQDMTHDPFDGTSTTDVQFGQWFTLPLAVGQLLIILLLFVTIFRFKKRILQIRLNWLNIFLNVLLVAGVFYYTTMLEEKTGVTSQYGISFIVPVIVIILLFVANYYIRKDEKLIRSADRLR